MREKKIGLALGSGAARGFGLFPIITKLEEEGIRIQAISGSSIGALIGAYYAIHGEIVSQFMFGKELTKTDYFKMADPNTPGKSVIKGNKLKAFLKDNFFGDKTFADTQIPMSICATDLNTNQAIYFEEGPLIDALMASISIPGIFPPYKIGNHFCIDGGVMDPVPVKPLLDKRIKKILAVNLMGYEPGYKDLSRMGMTDTLVATFYLMMSRLSLHEEARRIFNLTLNFPPDPANVLLFYKWKQYAEIGQKTIDAQIDKINSWLKS
jgi:NTE family protein